MTPEKLERIRVYNLNPKTCGHCKLAIPYAKRENKFCNQSCGAKHNNKGVRRNFRDYPPLCGVCGKATRKNQVHCSKRCYMSTRDADREATWLAGGMSSWSARHYLVQKVGNRCQICSWSEINPYSGTVPIELEHIDGDSSNNKPENLMLLCPNCHSLTSTYKRLNLGKGRHARMKRYNSGKSY